MLGLGINISFANIEKNSTEVHIGIYAPFSHKQAFIGRNILNAMEMARDKTHNDAIHYTFYTLDALPKNEAKMQVSLQKFIDTHKINVLVTEGSKNGLMVKPLAQKNNILHFSMASDPRIADGSHNFLAWSPDYEQAKVMVKTLQQKNIKEIALIATDEVSDQVLAKSVLKQIGKDSGIKIVLHEEIKADTTDYAPLIQKLKAKKPQLYLIMASPERIEKIQSAMSKAHIQKPITSIVDQVTPTVMRVFNGQWYVDTQAMPADFINEYQEINFNYPSTEAGYAYDVFNMVNASIEASLQKGSGFSLAALVQQIHLYAPGNGVMGPFNLNKQGVLYTQSEVKTIKDGQVFTA
ncbi:amino acid-binding protein [Legionella sp. km772]|nr:amino acid-binding protein [Legionella sp. km772]